jgi:hypothetical protein
VESAEASVLHLVLDDADEAEVFVALRAFLPRELQELERACRELVYYCGRELAWRDQQRRTTLSPGEAVMDLLYGPRNEDGV